MLDGEMRSPGPILLLSATLLTACAEAPPEPADEAYRAEIEQWRLERVDGLMRPDGWLSLAGLHWLDDGRHTVGSAPGSGVRLPAGAPETLGVLDKEGSSVLLILEPGVEVTVAPEAAGRALEETSPEGPRTLLLASDAEGEPTTLHAGDVSFHLIQRGGDRLGVRVRDAAHPALSRFAGLEYFPADPTWNKTARYEPYDPPREIPVVDVLGMVTPSPVPGALVFEHDGETYRLDALDAQDELFVIFADETNGEETYDAGRYLYAAKPAAGEPTTRLDFNRAYNPPCAFTAYATCPLPPPQNHLPIRVEAGERYPGHGKYDSPDQGADD